MKFKRIVSVDVSFFTWID